MAFQVLCPNFARSEPMDELDDAKEWAIKCDAPFEIVDRATGEVVWDEDQMDIEAMYG